MIINRWVIIVFLLLLFARSNDAEIKQLDHYKHETNLNKYEFTADDLLSQSFPPHKFRDLKRRSRVIVEANNRMLHAQEDLLGISDEILDTFSEISIGSFSFEGYKIISLIPNSLLKFLITHVEKMMEGLPSTKPKSYFFDNEKIEDYKKAHIEHFKDYRVITIRAACRLLITSIMLSSLENLNSRTHSISIGITYPFLDDISIRPKSTLKSNITNILNRILSSFRNFGNRVKTGIKKNVGLNDDFETVDLEDKESNERRLTHNIYDHRQNHAVSIFGRDKVYFENNLEVAQVINNFIGKQERDSSILLQLLEKTIRTEVGLDPSKELQWGSSPRSKIAHLCRDIQILEILPKRMKHRTCMLLLNRAGEILTGFHYKSDVVNNHVSGRANMLKRIRWSSSLKLIQVSGYHNRFNKP
ncbi:hypothetical protein OIY81_374 [Cryptosporidium canis]|uniref:Uncharacterized protein n=1 Tax=Cryptosporidium canis TaxID=195482 RepID=A0ABQ8P8H9_9CRYT|nr:hypothetical protein OJ252_1430 [Cryptosporidium canis]KAJ1614647.1 hypothetical protein OIY81_374 [Cryptosporidium canis]